MSESNNTSNGLSFAGLLTILFIGLKLTNYINWSWWWVLSPIWISFSIFLILLIIIGVMFLITYLKA